MNKITNVKINNIIGIDRANIPIGDNITLICGPNASGKSSALDALAYTITGHKHRNLMPIKPNEVLAGEILADCSVEVWSGDELIASVIDGQVQGGGAHSRATVVPGAFMAGKPKDRVSFLLSACGIKIDPREVVAGITGLSEEDSAAILQRANIDLDTAEAWCRDNARKRKARWQAITGEEWGAKKAASWKRRPPEGDVEALERELSEVSAAAETMRAQAAKLAEEFGAALAAEQQVTARLPDEIRAERSELEIEIARLEEAVGSSGTVEPCPHCGQLVARPPTGGPLRKATNETTSPQVEKELSDKRARARLLDIEILRAQAQLDLRAEHRPTDVISNERGICNREAGRLVMRANELQTLIDTINGAAAATKAAQAEHVALTALLAAADELSPTGYPARKLRAAIGMVNAAMPEFSSLILLDDGTTAWAGHKRAIDWLSKSEAWRANAALSMALSAVSGATVVLLDEFDVVEPAHRMDVLRQIDSWARPRGIQVIIAATLKSEPNINSIATYWMGK